MNVPVIPDILRQHAELAAFHWAQHHDLAQADPPDAATLARIADRVEANLDGLRIAGEAAWNALIPLIEDYPEKGEHFACFVPALESGDARRRDQILGFARAGAAQGNFEGAVGLSGALAWLPPATSGAVVRDWLGSNDGLERWLATGALAHHRADPGPWLPRLLTDSDAAVRRAAADSARRAGRSDLVAQLRSMIEVDPDSATRLAAARAVLTLDAGPRGDPRATDLLRRAALGGGPDARAAMRTLVRKGPDADMRAWFSALLKSPDSAPCAVRGAGMLGDRTILPWLLRQMRIPSLAEPALAAFHELFPEARANPDLTTTDPAGLGPEFERHFPDDSPDLPDFVEITAWARAAGHC